ncbi:OX-2 membrane glycoprotein [Puma concolor]|uniref:OX-2 membrane glycoprotein n=1 Tax=Puma concolor TaxID=9696 RepID=A0A6P6H0Y1_PUMCO|nr:OX-2 membrane glycoprotein [Puma concolor]
MVHDRGDAPLGLAPVNCPATPHSSPLTHGLGGGGGGEVAFRRPPNASPLPGSPSSLSAQLHSPEESDRGWHQGAFRSVPQQGKGNEHKPDSPHRIKYKNNETAVFGENVTIFCNLTTPADVVQITWQKIQGSSRQNIGTYSNIYGEKILPPYRDRLHCEVIEPNSSFITIREVTFEDEACYKCLFNVFPQGSHSGQICLNIIVQPTVFLHYKFFEDHVNITCSANARPAPVISWKVSGSGIENSTEILSHPNGTTSVTSVLQVKDPKSQVGKEVICQVLHLGTMTSVRQTLDKGFWFSVPLLLSIVSLVILLVLISILLYWKRRRNQDRALPRASYSM